MLKRHINNNQTAAPFACPQTKSQGSKAARVAQIRRELKALKKELAEVLGVLLSCK
jgi:hypothetical protein